MVDFQYIDFQVIVDLDRKIVMRLKQFLQEKESRLAHHILNIFSSSLTDSQMSFPISETPMKLSEAVEIFGKKVRFQVEDEGAVQYSNDFSEQTLRDINKVLWEFIEILEGCAVELFQKVQRVTIDRWHTSFFEVVYAIKDMLMHYIEDLIATLPRLEKILIEYFKTFHIKGEWSWKGWLSFRKNSIDRNLLKNLRLTEKFLNKQYDDFQYCYSEYMRLDTQMGESLRKMKNFLILTSLDASDQNLYTTILRLLKILVWNSSSPNGALTSSIIRALKHLTSVDNVLRIFRIYYGKLKDAFFNKNIEWKSLNHEEENFKNNLEKLQKEVGEHQDELKILMHAMSLFRTFILKNDGNPYVRSRWGFSEWIVGPEPVKAKKIANMIYSANELNQYFIQFHESLESHLPLQKEIECHARQKINDYLHEMRQPLISRFMMKSCLEQLLEELKLCEEIRNPSISIIYFLEDVLAEAMRQDWKYHVLHEIPLFHQIYHLHLGFMKGADDSSHSFRLERFHRLVDQMKGWVEKEGVVFHVHEIDLDMEEMKTHLQDFLRTVQSAMKEKSHDPFFNEKIYQLRRQLLDYRYLFGQFFWLITSKNLEGMQLRNQLLFIDQYFESVEMLFNENKT